MTVFPLVMFLGACDYIPEFDSNIPKCDSSEVIDTAKSIMMEQTGNFGALVQLQQKAWVTASMNIIKKNGGKMPPNTGNDLEMLEAEMPDMELEMLHNRPVGKDKEISKVFCETELHASMGEDKIVYTMPYSAQSVEGGYYVEVGSD